MYMTRVHKRLGWIEKAFVYMLCVIALKAAVKFSANETVDGKADLQSYPAAK